MADRLRDLQTRFGARQYRVDLVWTRWSGGERGIGNEEVVRSVPILPTPYVPNMALNTTTESMGTLEEGSVQVTEISPRYDEDTLMGRDIVVPKGDPIPADVNFWWEVTYPQAGQPDAIRRRFTPVGTAAKDPTGFQWKVRLVKAQQDRTTLGEPT